MSGLRHDQGAKVDHVLGEPQLAELREQGCYLLRGLVDAGRSRRTVGGDPPADQAGARLAEGADRRSPRSGQSPRGLRVPARRRRRAGAEPHQVPCVALAAVPGGVRQPAHPAGGARTVRRPDGAVRRIDRAQDAAPRRRLPLAPGRQLQDRCGGRTRPQLRHLPDPVGGRQRRGARAARLAPARHPRPGCDGGAARLSAARRGGRAGGDRAIANVHSRSSHRARIATQRLARPARDLVRSASTTATRSPACGRMPLSRLAG